ncbi:hypothetical protein L6164_025889 [Bauhinia variegata]|uniref:Uncharacterized protein n=1 Tax=Bauhinia variegata TaxID=167791 RepID=A0ACB9M2B0_BAUVA|nr:hypothetical protein L6164_025889 [Bauhinia variegata]
MAAPVYLLCKKLKKLAEEKPEEEISPHLLKMATEFERLLQALSIPIVELRRENDVALGKAISQILALVEEVEDITDSYSHTGQSLSDRKSLIYNRCANSWTNIVLLETSWVELALLFSSFYDRPSHIRCRISVN